MSLLKDLTGLKFGSLTVIEKTDKRLAGRIVWKCQCDCGNIIEKSGKNLLNGHTRHCPNCKAEDLSGKRFGLLVPLNRIFNHTEDNIQVYWLCKCDCGNTTIVTANHLKSGHTRSCGCLQKQIATELCTVHGKSGTRLHTIWRSMLSRCNSSNSGSYRNYGARGIVVCREWKEDFVSFYKWALNSGYKSNLYLERIDNNGNYEPSNCTWKTYKEQQRNKRTNHFITYNGKTQTMIEWAEEIGINYATLNYRINIAKWDIGRALTEPVNTIYR